jgi:hypothetical protein
MYVVLFHKETFFPNTLVYGTFALREDAELWLNSVKSLTTRTAEIIQLERPVFRD